MMNRISNEADTIQSAMVGINLHASPNSRHYGALSITSEDQTSRYYIQSSRGKNSVRYRLYNREWQAVDENIKVHIDESEVRLIFFDGSLLEIPISSENRTPAQQKYFCSCGRYCKPDDEF